MFQAAEQIHSQAAPYEHSPSRNLNPDRGNRHTCRRGALVTNCRCVVVRSACRKQTGEEESQGDSCVGASKTFSCPGQVHHQNLLEQRIKKHAIAYSCAGEQRHARPKLEMTGEPNPLVKARFDGARNARASPVSRRSLVRTRG